MANHEDSGYRCSQRAQELVKSCGSVTKPLIGLPNLLKSVFERLIRYAFLTLHRNALNSGILLLGSATRGVRRLVLSPLDIPM